MRLFALTLLLFASAVLQAQDSPGVAERIYAFGDEKTEIFSGCFENPSLQPLRHKVSLTEVYASFNSLRQSEATDLQRGKGEWHWEAGADSYIHHRSATLWGHASYRNGRRLGPVWNESSDIDLIYPYVLADSLGGDINGEIYSLRGGYADSKGCWRWGVEASYDATLEYRKIDPRPKNVSGLLMLRAGVGYDLDRLGILAFSFGFEKYKQTDDIRFVSETGKVPIIHPTGPGSHYHRFAGTSETAHFTGEHYSLSLDLMPGKERGVVASARYRRFSFEKQLTDLNRLPLCQARQNDFDFSAGWLDRDWALAAKFKLLRRHGFENLFGDASANVYPLIGRLETYADNRWHFLLTGTRILHFSETSRISFTGEAGYRHREELYVDPSVSLRVYDCTGHLRLLWHSLLSGKWNLSAGLDGGVAVPVSTLCGGLDYAALSGLRDVELTRFRFAEKVAGNAGVNLEVSRAVGSKCALGIAGSWNHGFFRDGVYENRFAARLELKF